MSDLDATVIVPCRNEQANVGQLLRRLARVLAGRRCEVLFIDDSDDDTTVRVIRAVAAKVRSKDLRVVAVHRQGAQRWGGLAGAVIDGLRQAGGDVVVVMDADLQHPPETRPGPAGPARGRRRRRGPGHGQPVRPRRRRGRPDGPLRRLVSTALDLARPGRVPGAAARRHRPDDRLLRAAPVDGRRRPAPGATASRSSWRSWPPTRRCGGPRCRSSSAPVTAATARATSARGWPTSASSVRLRLTVVRRSRGVTRTLEVGPRGGGRDRSGGPLGGDRDRSGDTLCGGRIRSRRHAPRRPGRSR